MDKQNMIYPYNELLLSHNKWRNIDIFHNMNESRKYCHKWNNQEPKEQILYDSIHMKYPVWKNIQININCLGMKGGWGNRRDTISSYKTSSWDYHAF